MSKRNERGILKDNKKVPKKVPTKIVKDESSESDDCRKKKSSTKKQAIRKIYESSDDIVLKKSVTHESSKDVCDKFTSKKISKDVHKKSSTKKIFVSESSDDDVCNEPISKKISKDVHKKSSTKKTFVSESSDDVPQKVINESCSATSGSSDGTVSKNDDTSVTKKYYYKSCPTCGLHFPSKTKYEAHMNRIFSCRPNKIHGNVKEILVTQIPQSKREYMRDANGRIVCNVCPSKRDGPCTFQSVGNFNRHCSTTTHKNCEIIHRSYIEMCGDHNIGMQNIYNNHGTHNETVTKIDKSVHNITNIHNIDQSTNNITLFLHDYLFYDINDLSLFDQYNIFQHKINEKQSPYTNLLDQFNFDADSKEYHNIKRLTDDLYMVYMHHSDSKKTWNEGSIRTTQKLALHHRAILSAIYNKFRFFLSRKAGIFGAKCVYDGFPDSHGYNSNNSQIHNYILSMKRNPKSTYGGRVYPSDRDDPIWSSLSKSFNFKEVEEFIKLMVNIGVDFSASLGVILGVVENHAAEIAHNKPLSEKLDKLIKRLKFLEYKKIRFEVGYNNDPDSSRDEEERYHNDGSDITRHKKKYVDIFDHAQNDPVNRYYGVDNIDSKKKCK